MAGKTQPFTSVYDLDYFSGSQMFLYIGDVWVDEITSLQYQTTQRKQPIYGYASQLWDDVTAGQVIVHGNFTINFKEQGYLWAVLRRYFEIAAVDTGIPTGNKAHARAERNLLKKQEVLAQKGQKIIPGALGSRPLVGSHGSRISRASIERLVRGEATRNERYDFYNSLAGYATVDSKSPRDKQFEDIMEVFEDQIWGKESTNYGLNSQLRRTDNNAFDGFDMYVVFGNYANAGANHTVQKIIDVRLQSQGKAVSIDGMPVQEQYGFIAQSTV